MTVPTTADVLTTPELFRALAQRLRGIPSNPARCATFFNPRGGGSLVGPSGTAFSNPSGLVLWEVCAICDEMGNRSPLTVPV
jgi:hypothetical protein